MRIGEGRGAVGVDSLYISIMVASLGVLVWALAGSQRVPQIPTAAPTAPTTPISLTGVATKGSVRAKVAVLEYSEFQCPYCRVFATTTLLTLKQQYVDPGRVLLAFAHLPLRIHATARQAAQAAECARQQGRFWDFHDALFQVQSELDRSLLLTLAGTSGLEASGVSACLESRAAIEAVDRDMEAAARLGVVSTPTFFIGTLEAGVRLHVSDVLVGARPVAEFQVVLDRLIERTR